MDPMGENMCRLVVPQISCRVPKPPGACTPGRKEHHRQHGRTKCGKKKGILGGFLLEKKQTERVWSQKLRWLEIRFGGPFEKSQPHFYNRRCSNPKRSLVSLKNWMLQFATCHAASEPSTAALRKQQAIAICVKQLSVPAAWWFRLRNFSLFSPPFLRYKHSQAKPHPSGRGIRGVSLDIWSPTQTMHYQVQKSFKKLTIDFFIYTSTLWHSLPKKDCVAFNDPQKN